jgi:LmbE family N-acetylglucosaminyl deacetylase
MTHVFVAPHADDVALSYGGLIARLRGIDEDVTVVSGSGAAAGLTTHQRRALGFSAKMASPSSLPGIARRYQASSRL